MLVRLGLLCHCFINAKQRDGWRGGEESHVGEVEFTFSMTYCMSENMLAEPKSRREKGRDVNASRNN
jgi:hypothetical protein